MYTLERACSVQVAALAGGRGVVTPTVEVQKVVTMQVQGETMRERLSELAWPGLLRMLDADDSGYRE